MNCGPVRVTYYSCSRVEFVVEFRCLNRKEKRVTGEADGLIFISNSTENYRISVEEDWVRKCETPKSAKFEPFQSATRRMGPAPYQSRSTLIGGRSLGRCKSELRCMRHLTGDLHVGTRWLCNA